MIDVKKLKNYKIEISYLVNGEKLGYVIIEVLDTINIIDVFVKESYRGRGISKILFDYLFNNYKNVRFMLEVRSKNFVAINLYESYNFKTIHVREKYYKDDDALIMEADN